MEYFKIFGLFEVSNACGSIKMLLLMENWENSIFLFDITNNWITVMPMTRSRGERMADKQRCIQNDKNRKWDESLSELQFCTFSVLYVHWQFIHLQFCSFRNLLAARLFMFKEFDWKLNRKHAKHNHFNIYNATIKWYFNHFIKNRHNIVCDIDKFSSQTFLNEITFCWILGILKNNKEMIRRNIIQNFENVSVTIVTEQKKKKWWPKRQHNREEDSGLKERKAKKKNERQS